MSMSLEIKYYYEIKIENVKIIHKRKIKNI